MLWSSRACNRFIKYKRIYPETYYLTALRFRIEKSVLMLTIMQIMVWPQHTVQLICAKWLKPQKQPPEVFCKKVVLEISQNSKENTCARDSFLIKLQAGHWHRRFPMNFAKFLRTLFLQNVSGRLLLKPANLILMDSSEWVYWESIYLWENTLEVISLEFSVK